MGVLARLQHAWNAFTEKPSKWNYWPGPSTYGSMRPDRNRLKFGNERTISASILSRIAIDCAAIDIRHVRKDDNGRYTEEIDSGLNYCLRTEANIDQTGRAFIQDIVESMCDEGCVAVVPVDCSIDPKKSGSYQIETLRVGEIVEWYPDMVKVKCYNDKTGLREEVMCFKKNVAIIENPLYSVMNEPNSTLRRLIRKLALLDMTDEAASSGKLDLIIQLPYVVKNKTHAAIAEQRKQAIEDQLVNSQYGIAYIDGTEKITQLNRSIDNQLLDQIEYLTTQLYAQLGLTEAVFDGTADEQTMLNYYSRTIEPIMAAIANEFERKFITKTARSQGQGIAFFRDPFKLVPAEKLADIADKLTRNEILSSNEIRAEIGYRPVSDPSADQLRNKNINQSTGETSPTTENLKTEGDLQNGS